MNAESTILGLDHTGIVVPELESAVSFYVRVFGAEVVDREPETDVNATALGLSGERVRLRGAFLRVGEGLLELHEYLTPRGRATRRTCDTGIGHVAFSVKDIDAACAHLERAGVQFESAPITVVSGARAGRRWVYGRDPWGVTVELCQHAS
ncbi:VOC family protein [Streptomyces sp. AA0539]|uniref:VOC family protein n=1 Tax=Streptomyces sp. AA0539 TaxID=1210045 RepID=UPI0002ED7801|nr:VOC family protein [Streptomyces sp. AA0539]